MSATSLPPLGAAGSPDWVSPSTAVNYGFILVVMVLILVTLLVIAKRLSASSSWKLADAASEEAEVTDPENPAQKRTELRASSSRLIALLGMFVILGLFMGTGVVVLWGLVSTGKVPNLDGILKFFLAGAGLFIPYSVNQVRAGFSSN
jgi:hypothetical protein